MKTISILIPTTFFILFYGCSDSDDIPTSSDRDSVKVVEWKTLKEDKSKSYQDDDSDDLDEKKELPFPTFPNQTTSNEDIDENEDVESSSDDDNYAEEDSYLDDETENYSEDESNYDDTTSENESEVVQDDENTQTDSFPQQEESSDSSNDYSNYGDKLESEVQEAMKNYPRPPSPANLSPYDNKEKDSYREPTQQESQSGVGDFPPVPPAMFLTN